MPTSVANKSAAPLSVATPNPKRRSQNIECEDGALVKACQRGEHKAMELLYHRYKRRVFGLVTRIVGVGDAEEVVQEVFVRIYRGLARFRGDSALSTWIYRLSVNASLSHVSRRKRRPECEEWVEQVPAPTPPSPDPALSSHLERALAALPVGYRTVLVLHDIQGLNHEECAAILGCRIGTSKSQLHKARAKMRDLLKPVIERKDER